jgi:uncharacterized protein (DUF952 family)
MTHLPQEFVFKITTAPLWQQAQNTQVVPPSPIDVADGYMHLSDATQTRETLALHFAGQSDLQLLRVPVARLGDALKWEVSRGGQLFPHLYADLALASVDAHVAICVTSDRKCSIPDGFL